VNFSVHLVFFFFLKAPKNRLREWKRGSAIYANRFSAC
jgi:hypothetical protein